MPGIGDIPILGNLFKSRAAQKDQTELVVMITPEILSTDSVGVTANLPRTPDSFMQALPENKTKAPAAPAFSPERRSSVSQTAVDVVVEKRKAEQERDRIRTEAKEVAQGERDRKAEEAQSKADALAQARAKVEEARAAEKAAQVEARRQRDEQKRAEKEARALEKQQREQEARDAKAVAEAPSAEPVAQAQPESDAAAHVQQAAAVEQAVDGATARAVSDDERRRATEVAEFTKRALETETEAPAAQIEK
jgi:hypothetical protein